MPRRPPTIEYASADAQASSGRGLAQFLAGSGCAALTTVVVTGLVVLTRAGPRWPVVVWELLTDGLLVATWLASLVGWGGLCFRSLFTSARGSRAFVTFAALGLGIIGFFSLALGLAGALNRVSAWAVVLVGVVLLLSQIGSSPGSIVQWVTAVSAWSRRRAGADWLWVLASPIFAMLLLGALTPPGVLWGMDEPNGYDVLAYHLQVPREWYELGRIVPLQHNVFSYFPMGVEVHYLLAMHLTGGPWAGMFAAQLMHAAMMLLTVAAVYSFTPLSVVLGRLPAVLAGVACLAVPWLTLTGSIAYDEAGLLLFGTLAVGWLNGNDECGMMNDELKTAGDRSSIHHPSPILHHFFLSGLFAGLAGGAKLTGVPLFTVGLPLAILCTARRGEFRQVLRGLAFFSVAGVLTLSPWLIRNVAWAGNPVFPEAMAVFGKAHFSDTQVERWTRAHSPPAEQRSIAGRLDAFKAQVLVDDRFGYLLLPLGLAAFLLARDRPAAVLATMVGVIAMFWTGFTHLQGRFFMPAVPLLAMGVGRVRVRSHAAGLFVPVLALLMLGTMSLDRRSDARSTDLIQRSGATLADLIGFDGLTSLANLPSEETLGLVGDAGAFMYRRPTPLLKYRSVFDVDVKQGEDLIGAWSRDWPVGTTLLISPGELDRFAKTYYGIPAPPVGFTREEIIVKKQ